MTLPYTAPHALRRRGQNALAAFPLPMRRDTAAVPALPLVAAAPARATRHFGGERRARATPHSATQTDDRLLGSTPLPLHLQTAYHHYASATLRVYKTMNWFATPFWAGSSARSTILAYLVGFVSFAPGGSFDDLSYSMGYHGASRPLPHTHYRWLTFSCILVNFP